MKAVSIEAVRKSYGPTSVLKGIDLEINAGEFVVLLGPSGCGKSTLLHAIAGLDDIDDGDIKIGGKSVLDLEPKDRGIAMVFQSYALYPTMTVKQNLSFGLRMNHVKAAEIEYRVMKAATMLQIVELLDRKPANLSGGQRQRVAIGRALVRDVAVFLFDEPLSNLDAKLRTEMRLELKRLHDILGATMIYVTHDQVEAMTMADRIAVLRAGVLEQFATPQVIYDEPANLFVASFVGSPEINKFEGNLRRHGNGAHFIESGSVAIDLEGYAFLNPPIIDQRVILSIRAENLIPHSGTSEITQRRVLEVRPALFEPLGSETLVWCDSLVGRICVRLRPDQCVDLPESMTLSFDLAHISLFDAESTRRL